MEPETTNQPLPEANHEQLLEILHVGNVFTDSVYRTAKWAFVKGIIEKGTYEKQVGKTVEEANELLKAVLERDIDEIEDAIGDTIVTLVVFIAMWNNREETKISFLKSWDKALKVIEARTGKMVNGEFIKNE